MGGRRWVSGFSVDIFSSGFRFETLHNGFTRAARLTLEKRSNRK